MRLVKANLYRFSKDFLFGFLSPQTRRKRTESLILRLQFEGGIEGYGESAPRAYVTGETPIRVEALMRRIFLPFLFSREIRNIADIRQGLDALEERCRLENEGPYLSALGAVDLALLDALGKQKKAPLSRLLGAASRPAEPNSIAVPILSREKIRKLHALLPPDQFKYAKILMGDDDRENRDRIALIRSLFGEGVEIRIEVNGKWDLERAVSQLERLRGLGIQAVEQPLPRGDLEGLKKLRERISLPIILDESICATSDAEQAFRLGVCDMINIKISKCGGLMRSVQLADWARARDIPFQLGSHVGETDILLNAGKHFAAASPDLVYYEGGTALLYKWVKAGLESRPGQGEENRLIPGLGLASGWEKDFQTHSTLIFECQPPQ